MTAKKLKQLNQTINKEYCFGLDTYREMYRYIIRLRKAITRHDKEFKGKVPIIDCNEKLWRAIK